MKFWFLALITACACAGLLAWVVQRQVIPRFLANANAEMVAAWHAALTERRADTGDWPEMASPGVFAGQMFSRTGPDGRRVADGYLHDRHHRYDRTTGEMPDIYGNALKITFSGAACEVRSAGADGVWGTADDVSSDHVREHGAPKPEPARDHAPARQPRPPAAEGKK